MTDSTGSLCSADNPACFMIHEEILVKKVCVLHTNKRLEDTGTVILDKNCDGCGTFQRMKNT